MGLQIDNLVVYVDISDIQDEAIFYRFDAQDHVQEGNFDPGCHSPELKFSPGTDLWSWSYSLEFLKHFYTRQDQTPNAPPSGEPDLTLPGRAYGRDRARASWTYDPQSTCYGTTGIEGGYRQSSCSDEQALRAS